MNSIDDNLYLRNPAHDVERLAVAVVEGWVGIAGAVTDESDGHEPDIRIDYHDGRIGLCEVTWHEDPQVRAMWAAAFKEYWHQVIRLPLGVGQWTVKLKRGASIKRLSMELGGLIELMASQSVRSLEILGASPRGGIADEARRLGITYIYRGTTGPDLAVYLMPSTGGVLPDDPNTIVEWIESVLWEPRYADVSRKLLDRDAHERHVFIMTGSATEFGVAERLQRLEASVPSRQPQLPSGITHVWAVSQFGVGPVAMWCKRGWALVPIPPEEAADARSA